MPWYTAHLTDRYHLEVDRMGFYKLTRSEDGAEAYFQGDDAILWDRNMTAIETCHEDSEPALNRSFNCLCEGYDDVLVVPTTLL